MRNDILAKLQSAPKTQVDLGNMNIKDGELAEIVKEIKDNHDAIESIFLNNNHISDQGALVLGELGTLKNLIFIDLQFNLIDKKGAAAVCALKNSHPKLVIALHGNKITDVGEMQKIEESVKKS